MSNVLSPIVARYSLFFALSMFSSSIISQTKQPTHLVQALLIKAQHQYQDKATQKRALIRNTSSTSTSSSALSRSSTFPSDTNSTQLSSPSSFTSHSGTEAPSFSLELPSFPLADKRAGSSTQKSNEHRESISTTLVFTLPNQTKLSHVRAAATPSGAAADAADRLNPPRVQAASAAVAVLPRENNTALAAQGPQVSKSSIATLLSVTLTMILLSLLQNKKRRLRRKARSLRATRRHHSSKHRHCDDYKTSTIDRSTNYPYSPSSRTNTPTLIDGVTESAQSLTQSHAHHHNYYSQSAGFANSPDREPAHFSLSRANDSDRQSSLPHSPAMLKFESGHPSGTSNLYDAKTVGWSLSDGHLPAKQSKDDFVTAWLEQQSSALGDVGPESFEVNHPGWGVSRESIHWLEEPQQSYAPLDLQNQPVNNDTQREPWQEFRASHQTIEYYQGSLQTPQHPPPARQSPTLIDHHRLNAPHHQWQDQHHYQIQPQNLHPHSHHLQLPQFRSSHLPEHQGYHHQPYNHGRHEAFSSPEDHLRAGRGPRRSLSLTQTFPARLQSFDHLAHTPSKFEDLTPAEQVRQEHYLRRQQHQVYHYQLQQHRQQRQPHQHLYQQDQHQYRSMSSHRYNHQVHHTHTVNKEASSSVYDLRQYPSRHQSFKARTVRELAWERHCYYLQRQEEEEALAEQKRREIQWREQQQEREQGQHHPLHLQLIEQNSVIRTGSLGRNISSSLSTQAAHALDRSRSKSAAGFISEKQSAIKSSDTAPCSNDTPTAKTTTDRLILTAGHRLMSKSETKELKTTYGGRKNVSEPGATNTEDTHYTPEDLATLQPFAHPSQESTTSLSRRSTLKNIGPSIRSLARRCSSRFSNRPNSFAGSGSDPIIPFTEGKAVNTGSLSNGASHGLRSLTPGPDGIVDLQQSENSAVTYYPPASASTPFLPLETTPERVPIHRRVTLFRSKTTRLSQTSVAISDNESGHATVSKPVNPMMTTAEATVTRAKSLSARPRDSLRLANGRGFDLNAFQTEVFSEANTTAAISDCEGVERSRSELERALPVNVPHAASEEDHHEATRRQINALLAMARKERISAKTGQAVPATTTRPSNLVKLSPLALEAQDDYVVTETKAEEKKQKDDPCDRIAFMLVPKSRYEFQPLVAP